MNLTEQDKLRFWSKVNKDGRRHPVLGTRCWLWTAHVNVARLSVGDFSFRGRHCRAPRVAWIIEHGPIPTGLHVCHRCDDERCVRGDHLFLGTRSENMRDMVAKKRHWVPAVHRPACLSRGERHYGSKLTADDVAAIRADRSGRGGGKRLALRFGVSRSVISEIVNCKAWKEVGL